MGYVNYLKMIFSYLPSLILVPYAILFFNIPEWLKIWLFASIIISFGTLFISWFRCLGGGHLYLFNVAALKTVDGPKSFEDFLEFDSQILSDSVRSCQILSDPIRFC